MKRWLWFAVICLIIGAIINIVVAWWITVADTSQWTFGGFSSTPNEEQSDWWSYNAPPGFSPTATFVVSKPMTGVWTELLMDRDFMRFGSDTEQGKPSLVERRRAGWPFKSLQGQQWIHGSDHSLNQSIGIWQLLHNKPWLPVQPMWSGFLANSVLFALAPFLILAAFASARRHRRRHRHQCLHCGYPIGTSPVCTECGRAVARTSVA